MPIEFFAGTEVSGVLAYIDPGLGSMQLQILIAAFLSASFFVKTHFIQAKSFIGRFLKKSA